ncbi:MAG: DNA cytosine methyltransferase [Deltaproteobacteria bacterium]|nr:DNA cytosine methyltransferase [Deltaproteobacteria bacterium]
MKSIELFTGAGGMALGLARASFHVETVIERDPWACDSIRLNQQKGIEHVCTWRLLQSDVREVNFEEQAGDVALLAGGPPCQPFSVAGRNRTHGDDRNMFPAMLDAVRAVAPFSVLIENVPGLLRGRLQKYFEYVILQLGRPTLLRRDGESWAAHAERLREAGRSHVRATELAYDVRWQLLEAANFGVPQRRTRVFIVAFRRDLGTEWAFPTATHSREALLRDQWLTGDYWKRHGVPRRRRPTYPYSSIAPLLRAVELPAASLAPWRTVRDALARLPEPSEPGEEVILPNHVLIRGARPYRKHTGSPLDEPAKTLKAGNHGVPGGENMIRRPDGSVRYFSIRECARLQGFPDDYEFVGSWKHLVRQLGNAVPVDLAEVLGKTIHATLRRRRPA